MNQTKESHYNIINTEIMKICSPFLHYIWYLICPYLSDKPWCPECSNVEAFAAVTPTRLRVARVRVSSVRRSVEHDTIQSSCAPLAGKAERITAWWDVRRYGVRCVTLRRHAKPHISSSFWCSPHGGLLRGALWALRVGRCPPPRKHACPRTPA